MRKRFVIGSIGISVALLGGVVFAYSPNHPLKRLYLPGPTTAGHYQIELACDACHTKAFTDTDSIQKACVRCHGQELKAANDSHPEKKFTDPRNAERVAALDARFCATCHREHRPEVVSSMGLSLPVDYCYRCHQSIGDERPSHEGLGYDTCAAAGCHNFHDNRALYEDFLEKHLNEAPSKANGKNPARQAAAPRSGSAPKHAVAASLKLSSGGDAAWRASGHFRAGVVCGECHAPSGQETSTRVESAVCGKCHEYELSTYRSGRHGMREAQNLGAMRVSEARAPMKPSAHDRELGCMSCHGAHAFDTRNAAAQACLGCHDDTHTKAYSASSHARLWNADPSGQSGASCATCHLPRVDEEGRIRVLHNQNDVLRPNEKQVRTVCLNCHGLEFALSALADPKLIANNFQGQPSASVQSLDWVQKRLSAR
ncbi:MAG TPA: cytochrome c3 family protein [Polyangiaceae bacterium]